MFTGLIEATGTIVSVTPTAGATRLLLDAPALAQRWRTGDSIAVNGVCLTALPADRPSRFAADLASETLARTTLGRLASGAVVNLELPTPAGSPLGGHVVQGHVDGVGQVEALLPLHDDLDRTDWRLTIEAPAALAPSIVSQGSVTLDGISLTVAKVHESHPDGGIRFDIAVIPHTYRSTNLSRLAPHSPINIETDVLARYAAQRVVEMPEPVLAAGGAGHTANWLTPAYLLANGY